MAESFFLGLFFFSPARAPSGSLLGTSLGSFRQRAKLCPKCLVRWRRLGVRHIRNRGNDIPTHPSQLSRNARLATCGTTRDHPSTLKLSSRIEWIPLSLRDPDEMVTTVPRGDACRVPPRDWPRPPYCLITCWINTTWYPAG